MDNGGFAVTVLVCVSNMHRNQKKTFPSPVEIHILICGHKLDPPPPKIPHCAQFYDNAACVQRRLRLDIKWRHWEQRFVSAVLAVHSCSRRQPDTPDFLIPISPVYQQLIHMWG